MSKKLDVPSLFYGQSTTCIRYLRLEKGARWNRSGLQSPEFHPTGVYSVKVVRGTEFHLVQARETLSGPTLTVKCIITQLSAVLLVYTFIISIFIYSLPWHDSISNTVSFFLKKKKKIQNVSVEYKYQSGAHLPLAVKEV